MLLSETRRTWLAALIACLVLATLGNPAEAQRADAEVPEPETMSLTTGDGLILKCTFYAGTNGKESVPIVMLHMAQGSRGDFDEFAQYLQTEFGHAVLVPDLRGHGDSTKLRDVRRPLEAGRLPTEQYRKMVTQDMPAIKKFLRDENNEGHLNLDKLCLVGAELGAVVAINFAARDWTTRDYGPRRMGRFVRALVLISPEWRYKSLRIEQAVGQPDVRSKIAVHILVGEDDSSAKKNAERLNKALAAYHPKPPPERVAEEKDLFLDYFPTKLQGTKMLGEGLDVERRIGKFIELRLVNQDYPWSKLQRPFD